MDAKLTDPYYRKHVDLQSSEVEYSNAVASSGATSKISRVLLKFIQDKLYSFKLQDELESLSKEHLETLQAEYKESFYKKRRSLFDDSDDIGLDKAYKLALPTITKAAQIEAWKRVIQNHLNHQNLEFVFSAQEVMQFSKIKNGNSKNFFEAVSSVQNIFNIWSEPKFNAESGEVYLHKFRGTLFPTIELIRNGRGRSNEIKVSMNPSMAHLILFLNKKFLSFHTEIATQLGTETDIRIYEILIETINPIRIKHYGFRWEISDIYRRWHITSSNLSQSLSRTIIKPVEKINKLLDASIGVKKIRTGKKYTHIEFIISASDELRLRGKESKEQLNGDQLESFGYYLALLDYHNGKLGSDALIEQSIAIENLIETGSLEPDKAHYDAFTDNLKSLHLLQQHIDRGELHDSVYLDPILLTLVYKSSGAVVAPFASDCITMIEHLHTKSGKQLPGLENSTLQTTDSIESYFPFTFANDGINYDSIDAQTYAAHKRAVTLAIKYGDIDKFRFTSSEQELRFLRHIMKRDDVTYQHNSVLEVEVVDAPKEHALIEAVDDAQLIIDFYHEINPKSRATYAQAKKAVNTIYASGYDHDDITALLAFYKTSEGEFFSLQVGTPIKLSKKFDEHMTTMRRKLQAGVHSTHENIYDMLDQYEQ